MPLLQQRLLMTIPARSPPKRLLLLVMKMKMRSPRQRLLLKMLLKRSPPRRLLLKMLLSRNAQNQFLQHPSRFRLRSPQAQKVALHLPRLPLETGLKQLSPRYLSHESLDQAAPLLNLKILHRALSLPGRGSCAQTACRDS